MRGIFQMSKIKIPDVVERFQKYFDKNPTWGKLHIVLDDNNVEDRHIQFCIDSALDSNDLEAVELGLILLNMTKTQRLKLPHLCERDFSK
jgi:hypothetical protein